MKNHVSILPMDIRNGTGCGTRIHVMIAYFLQENYITPLEHTPGNPPGQLWKESDYSMLVKVAPGVFQRCVETTLKWVFPKIGVPPNHPF